MTAASLPSTLVKCLYLFFDLPEYESPTADATTLQTDKEAAEFSPGERRIFLQKVFVQVSMCQVHHPQNFTSSLSQMNVEIVNM